MKSVQAEMNREAKKIMKKTKKFAKKHPYATAASVGAALAVGGTPIGIGILGASVAAGTIKHVNERHEHK